MWSRSILVPFYLGVSPSFFLFLDFIAISDCVFSNKNNCVLGHTGYQIIITILVICSTPSLYANLRVATRVYDVEGGAIFSKNSTFVFFDGAAWTPRLRSPSPIMAPVTTLCKSHVIDSRVHKSLAFRVEYWFVHALLVSASFVALRTTDPWLETNLGWITAVRCK